MEPPFEIVGRLPRDQLREDLSVFAKHLEAHPWGGRSFDRLVVGNVDESLRTWLPPAEYREWQAGHNFRNVTIAAKTFTARDGRSTAVVPPSEERLGFLMLACHEMVEATLDHRQAQEGHEFVDATHTGMAHILWTEYVVERTRRAIASELGWGFFRVENGYIVEQMQELETELPSLVSWAVEHDGAPQRIYQLWSEMAHVYSMSLGRAEAGCPADGDQLRRFKQQPLVVESSDGWQALEESLRGVYEKPTEKAEDLDQLVRNDGWIPLYDVLATGWNDRYQAALQ